MLADYCDKEIVPRGKGILAGYILDMVTILSTRMSEDDAVNLLCSCVSTYEGHMAEMDKNYEEGGLHCDIARAMQHTSLQSLTFNPEKVSNGKSKIDYYDRDYSDRVFVQWAVCLGESNEAMKELFCKAVDVEIRAFAQYQNTHSLVANKTILF